MRLLGYANITAFVKLACQKEETTMNHLKNNRKNHMFKHLIQAMVIMIIATAYGTVNQASKQVKPAAAIQVGSNA